MHEYVTAYNYEFITKINLQINVVAARTKYLFSPSLLTANGNTVI